MRCMTGSGGVTSCWRRGSACVGEQGGCRHRRRHAGDDRAARRGASSSRNCKPRLRAGRTDRSRCGGGTFPSQTGRKRPLGIPTVRDRVVQMAAKIVHRADLRSGLPAVRATAFVRAGAPRKRWKPSGSPVAAATTTSWTIGHPRLLRRDRPRELLMELRGSSYLGPPCAQAAAAVVARRACMEDGAVRDTRRRVAPQGGVISPLLANIYLNDLDRIWTATCSSPG